MLENIKSSTHSLDEQKAYQHEYRLNFGRKNNLR